MASEMYCYNVMLRVNDPAKDKLQPKILSSGSIKFLQHFYDLIDRKQHGKNSSHSIMNVKSNQQV